MFRFSLSLILIVTTLEAAGQKSTLESLLADSVMRYASISMLITDIKTGEDVLELNPDRSLTQASVMKLVTSAAAIELLGPQYTFTTTIGYTGKINNGVLKGDIIIKGGGDPTLGSDYFPEQDDNFIETWVREIGAAGIKKIKGRVITDDSYYDYLPIPADWNWEDIGNYYGAGVYGLSLYDNTLKLHFATTPEGGKPVLSGVEPEGTGMEFINRLTSSGKSDQGYVFSSPYNSQGWIEGTIPANREDFVLKASIPDPPLLVASLLTSSLAGAGITVSDAPSTKRLSPSADTDFAVKISETVSPPLSEIIKVLNHESVNLYAEHLLKELGRSYRGEGTLKAGRAVAEAFLDSIGVDTGGMFILDGSGLSAQDAVNARGLTMLLVHMKREGINYEYFLNSLPEAGKNGTLKNYFRDPLFEANLRAKSGSMSRVRSYSGYFTTLSGRDMAFTIIINNYLGSSAYLITAIENILKECILNK